MKRERWSVMVLVLGATLWSIGCQGSKETKGDADGADQAVGKEAAVKVEMFVMSQCPYGVQALDGIIPALDKIGGGVGLQIEYIGQQKDGALESMHGESEVAGDIVQLCAAKLSPKDHLKLVSCMNESWRKIPENWEECAAKAGIDKAKLAACKDGAEGKELLAASFDRAAAAGATGSPTIKVNGKPYQGGRSPDDFTRSLCDAFGDKDQPKACVDLPPPAVVKVIGLTDARCKECAVEPIFASLKRVFPGLESEVIDYTEPEGKKLFQESGLKLLPAVLFEKTLDRESAGAKQVGRFLDPAGEYQSLRVGAAFDPTAEICDNGTDDTGDGLADCDDATCKEALSCRAEKKNRLDVFVMSQCPYGVMGLDAMKEVLGAFGSELSFGVHFIGGERNGELMSMHGPAEVAEDIRELCAIKHYPKQNKFMDYVWCRNKSIRSDEWQTCTGANGIATQVIEKCSTGGEGAKLLAEDFKLAESLKIGGSPTWLVNNRHTFNGVAPGAIQGSFCARNPGLKGCSATLSNAMPKGAPPGGSCGGQ